MPAAAGALLIAALLAADAALAQGSAAGSTASGDASAPADASPPEIGARAEEVAAVLRQMTTSIEDEAAFDGLEARVATATGRIAERWTTTESVLSAAPRRNVLDSLEGSWHALKESLNGVNDDIETRARRRAADAATLERLRASWAHSLEIAQQAGAPAEVIERAQATIAAIDATRIPVDRRRQRVLVLQDAVSRSLQTCDDALDRIAAVRRLRFERMFTDREPPLWRAHDSAGPAGASAFRIAADIETTSDTEFVYVRNHWAVFAFCGALFVALRIFLRRMRPDENGSAADHPIVPSARSLFRMPWAGAFLIAVAVSRPLGRTPPAIPAQILLGLLAVAGARMLRPHVSRRAARVIYAFVALFFLATAIDLVELSPVVRRVAAIGTVWAAAALMFRMMAVLRGTEATGATRPRFHRFVPWLLRLFGAFLVVAGIAFVVGYDVFAVWLGAGTIQVSVLSLAILAFRIAADGIVAIALAHPPLSQLRAVAQRRATVDRALGAVLDLAAAGLWLRATLFRFEVLERAQDLAQAVLDARIQVGELDLALGRVLAFLAVAVGAYFVTRITVFLLEEDVYSRMELPRGVPYALSTVTRYALLLAGFLLALATLGLDLTRMTVLVSAFGIGIGFGLQQIVNNFVSGLILLLERPVQVGDSVQLGDLSGKVERIGIRSSTIRTADGADVIVPNSKVIEDRVTNWTLSDRRRCVTLDLTIAGNGDGGQIIGLLVETARRDPRVLADPPPEALLIRLGDADAAFQVRAWTEAADWPRLRSDLGIQVQRALRELAARRA